MIDPNKTFKDIDAYIDSFPRDVRKKLREIRDIVRKNAPEATEKISYGMPLFMLNGRLLYFAAHPHHIGFYPMKSPILAFKKELSSYKTAKGSIQFPMDKPLPLTLITKIVKFRVKENTNRR